jgi:ATP-binding cassette subfamily B protein
VVVLDDSASALDYATDARLRKALASLPGRPAIIVVSQRVAAVMGAQQILVLDHGRMAGLGTHDELLESCDLYREICLSQLRPEEVAA